MYDLFPGQGSSIPASSEARWQNKIRLRQRRMDGNRRGSGGKKLSAGVLLYRWRGAMVEVFLVHPGGPYWTRKDDGAWSIPKGEYGEGEDALVVARREFAEETSSQVTGSFHPLASLPQPSGKVVSAWAVEGDLDPATVRSSSFSLEWPPRSGRRQEFPKSIVEPGSTFPRLTSSFRTDREVFSTGYKRC